MTKIEFEHHGGRVRMVDSRVAAHLVKKGRGQYVTRDLRAEAPAAPVVAVTAPAVEVPKSTTTTAEAKARREAIKRS